MINIQNLIYSPSSQKLKLCLYKYSKLINPVVIIEIGIISKHFTTNSLLYEQPETLYTGIIC